MKKTSFAATPIIVAILGLLVSIGSAKASGTYTGRLPQPGLGAKGSTEQERVYYALGQRLFTGKIKLTKVPGAELPEQQKQLAALQKVLPPRVARKKNLVAFTGKLTNEQLQALSFYVKRRFASKDKA